jgi:hypothetical protein
MPVPVSVRLATIAAMLTAAGCAGTPPASPGEEKLETPALAARASEFYCASGRWPRDAAELEAFPLPERSRIALRASPAAVPWSLLRSARFQPEADGSLLISASLPPDRLADGPPAQPIDLNLEVAEPGCWPPVQRGS